MHMYMPSSLIHPSRDSLMNMEFPSSWVVPVTRFLQLILLPFPPPYASFSTDTFTVTGAFCFLMSLGIMAGLHYCASHQGHSSIWGLAAKSGSSWIL